MRLSLRQKHSKTDFPTGETRESPISPDSADGIMPNLLDMPNEILCSIIDRVNPGDLEHFAESSPLLKSLATNALEVHRKRERDYTNITLDGCDHQSGCHSGHLTGYTSCHPLHLLEQICAKPQLAWYPTSLRVDCCGAELEEHADEEFAPFMDDEEFDKNMASGFYDGRNDWETDALNVHKVMKIWAKDIRERVFDSGYFDEEGSERWYNRIRKGNREGILGLLLILLPNLEFIWLDEYTWHATFFGEIVKRITRPCRGGSSGKDSGSAQVLTKMHEVRLYADPRLDEYGGPPEDFDVAGSFARLPSMKRVHVMTPASRGEYSQNVFPINQTWAQMESQSSNVDEIHVVYGGFLGEESVMHCLRSLKTLRKFRYDWHGLEFVGPPPLDCDKVSRMLAAIPARFQSSLEYLGLKGSPLKGTSHIVIPLKCFEKLTKASLPINLFALGPKTHTGASPPDKTTTLDMGDGDKPQGSNLAKFARLVDILPRSMEMIKFYGVIGLQAVESMLEGLEEHKADRLPRLERVTFKHLGGAAFSDTAAALLDRCNEVGIELCLWM